METYKQYTLSTYRTFRVIDLGLYAVKHDMALRNENHITLNRGITISNILPGVITEKILKWLSASKVSKAKANIERKQTAAERAGAAITEYLRVDNSKGKRANLVVALYNLMGLTDIKGISKFDIESVYEMILNTLGDLNKNSLEEYGAEIYPGTGEKLDAMAEIMLGFTSQANKLGPDMEPTTLKLIK